MNQSFSKQGITARVIRSGGLLKVTLRSSNLPDQKAADLVKKGIANIKPQGISKVSLKGEQIGGKESWSTEWNLADTPDKTATIISSKKPRWYSHPVAITIGVIGSLSLLGGLGSLVEELKQPDAESEPAAEPAKNLFQTNYLPQGKQKGYEAAVAAQNAGESEWGDVALKWSEAIGVLNLVRADQPDYAEAQAKIVEYTANRDVANQRAANYKAKVAAAQPPKAVTQSSSGGYHTYRASAGLSGTTEVQWRWLQRSEYSCEYGTCFGMEVIAVEGCDSSLYVELALEDENDINIGMTNDTTGKVEPGQKARLIFNILDEDIDSAGLSEMSCY